MAYEKRLTPLQFAAMELVTKLYDKFVTERPELVFVNHLDLYNAGWKGSQANALLAALATKGFLIRVRLSCHKSCYKPSQRWYDKDYEVHTGHASYAVSGNCALCNAYSKELTDFVVEGKVTFLCRECLIGDESVPTIDDFSRPRSMLGTAI